MGRLKHKWSANIGPSQFLNDSGQTGAPEDSRSQTLSQVDMVKKGGISSGSLEKQY